MGILDIKAKLNNNINCNIEMQMVNQKYIIERLLFYWSKIYSSSIKSGGQYNNLQRTIAILISNQPLDKLKGIPDFITKWNITAENHRHLVLTNALEIFIIELKKVKQATSKNNILNSWLQFINNPEVNLNMENKEIKKAKKILQEISADERERRLTELREKYIMDQYAIEEYGYDKGLTAGIKQKEIEIVKKMKAKNFDIATISEITSLTVDEINSILSSTK